MSIVSFARTALVAVAVTACASSTDTGTTSAELGGSWKYTAVQTAPTRVTYAGTLTISQQSGATFAGGLDAEASTPQGDVQRVNGVVSGRVLGTSTVDFDMLIQDVTRRHVGTIRGDSIVGSWATTDLTVAGTYTMARIH
jgi:hypothetical protein